MWVEKQQLFVNNEEKNNEEGNGPTDEGNKGTAIILDSDSFDTLQPIQQFSDSLFGDMPLRRLAKLAKKKKKKGGMVA